MPCPFPMPLPFLTNKTALLFSSLLFSSSFSAKYTDFSPSFSLLTVLMFLQDMEFQNPSSKHARLENFESDTPVNWRTMFTKNDGDGGGGGGEEVGLSLGLGLGQMGKGTKPGGFTFLQKQELQHQSLIYKYIEAGLPVPLSLLVPIWKSVAATINVNGCFSHSFPQWGSMEYGRSLDPEPGRCRRTDGKKWRCGKEAVSNHKYCERHMHRGRHQRARKVAATLNNNNGATAKRNNVHMDMALHSNTSLSISLPCETVTSVSASSFVFCAKKDESSLCF